MTNTQPTTTTLHSEADVLALWETLAAGVGFDQRSLSLVFLDADSRTLPTLVPFDGLPAMPDRRMIRSMSNIVHQLVSGGDAAAVVMLLSRPGPEGMTGGDRRWAAALRTGISADLMPWPVHLATRGRVQVFAPDDLIAAS